MMDAQGKIYFPNLNGVRFIAALSVLIYHFFDTPMSSGHLGVVLFFVLSGFLITYLLIEEKINLGSISIKQFYIRRILRIWPLYFLIVLIASILFFIVNNGESSSGFSNSIIYYLLFIPNVAFVLHTELKFAGILWSVGSEEQFYFIWPSLMRIKKNGQIILILVSFILFFSLAPHVIDYINNNYFNNSKKILFYTSKILLYMSFNSMATGGLLAFLYKYYPQHINFLFNRFFQLISIITLLYCWIFNVIFLINDQFYATLFGILILNLALNPKVIFSLENKVFDYLGKISFGIYVYHLLAFEINSFIIVTLLKLPFHNSIYYFLLGILTTIIIATISYYFFEKPFLKLKQSKFSPIQSGGI